MLHNSRLKTFVWYSSVGLLVLFAVAVSLFRLYFSSVEEYRAQLEAMAGSYLGQPVTISGIDARVVGISPTVILSNVALMHKGGEALLSRFDAVSISLDPVASLRNGRPIIELVVSGANLEVTRNLDGSLGVQGLELAVQESQKGAGGTTKKGLEETQALGAWFLSQNRLALTASRISLHDKKSGERFSFDNVELELYNEGERHRLNGFVNLPRRLGRELRVAADIEGNPLQGKRWSGGFYVKTAQLQPRQWLQQLSWQGSTIREGVLDLELWSRWQDGKLESVTTRLQAAGLVLARGEHVQAIPHLSADARLLRQPGGWRIDLAELQLQHDEVPAQPMRWVLSRHNDETTFQADRLSIETMGALLPYLPPLDKQQAMVKQMAPGGLLKGLYLRQQVADKRVVLQGELQGLSLRPWNKIPGVTGVNAHFHFNGEQGRLRLSGENGELTLPRLFRAPLSLNSLNGELSLRREVGGWELLGHSLMVENRDLSAQLEMELRLAEGRAPWLSLQGRFSAEDTRAVPRYLPAGLLKEKSLYWLDNAFKAGRVPSGSLQYHGFLNHFPFREHQGRFEVLFDAEAVQLHYQDEWPDLHQLAGEVHFDGPGMWIEATGARLYDARLGPTKVSIANFRAPRLLVDGAAALSINDGLRFLHESPLSKNTGRMLQTMQGTGDVSLDLQLAIPLTSTVRESLPLAIDGRVDFADNRLDVVDGVKLKGLRGSLHFSENSFTAEQLTAELFGKPVTVVVMSDGGDKPKVIVAARGSGELHALREALRLPLLDYLEGEAEWQASLTLPRGVAAEGAELRIHSSLEGVSSLLPSPLTKETESRGDMLMSFFLSGVRSGEKRLTFGDSFGLIWRDGGRGGEHGLRRAQLNLGAIAPLSLPGRDVIEVLGKGGRLSLSRWQAVLRKLRGEGERTTTLQPPPVVVELQQLQLLRDAADDEQAAEPKVADIPAISFAVEQFSYGDLPLGRVVLKVVPQDKRLSIKDIAVESDLFTITGEGTWSEGGNTFFNYSLNSPDLGGMMRQLGFASVIQGGKTTSSGKVWWVGGPTAVSLAVLNGQLDLSIKEGTMVDVEPGAGRMLGILSLPALPRRLFLDFSDVFKEGLAFDTIQGDIRIEQGQAFTSNLRMESAPASILVSGRTGLLEQDFDQELYVVPNVSGTVSVASALAWGPQVAAVVALLHEVFKSDIKAATMSQYHISGSWRDPVIRRVTEQQVEQDSPLFME